MAEKWKYLIDAPFAVSSFCCDIMKKKPIKKYNKESGNKSIIGILAIESKNREQNYLKYGCNAFKLNDPLSSPIAFWRKKDILEYIVKNDVPLAKVYGKIIQYEKGYYLTGVKATGCMFCGFGVHLEKGKNRFQQMKITHPKHYDYIINRLGMGKVLDYINVEY